MFDWLFNQKRVAAKDYDRLVPRIAFLIDGVLEFHGPETLFVPYSTFVLHRDFSVSWTGGQTPHLLKPEELTFAYLHEGGQYQELKDSIQLGQRLGPEELAILAKRAVDVISTQLGRILKDRANAPDINL